MILPAVQGTCSLTDFFIYAACDVVYFDEFGHEFITSIKRNTKAGIHIHLFNPTQGQLNYCYEQGVSVTWEVVPLELFEPATSTKLEPTQLDRTINAMGKGGDKTILERMQKTYYACARFIRLQELFASVPILELDVDAIVRRPILQLETDYDFHIHHITGKKARFLAGGLWLNVGAGTSKFLNNYATQLKSYIERDYIYWGLDQDLLDPIVTNFKYGQLPMSYIDWNMHPDSIVWTAKGTRKGLAVFVNEKKKYKS